jgi:rhodanese-related sulfurtransferase
MSTLDREQPIVVHCATGYRSVIAASLLQRDGYADVADLVGGLAAWESAARAQAA